MACSHESCLFTDDHSFIQTLIGTLAALFVLYFGNAGLTLITKSSLGDDTTNGTNGSWGTEYLVKSAMNPSISGDSEGSSIACTGDCFDENSGETAMVALSIGLSAGGGGAIIVIISDKDAVPYSRVENNASKLYDSIQKSSSKDSLRFPAIIAETPTAMGAMQDLFGNCSIDRIEDTLSVLEILANEKNLQ